MMNRTMSRKNVLGTHALSVLTLNCTDASREDAGDALKFTLEFGESFERRRVNVTDGMPYEF